MNASQCREMTGSLSKDPIGRDLPAWMFSNNWKLYYLLFKWPSRFPGHSGGGGVVAGTRKRCARGLVWHVEYRASLQMCGIRKEHCMTFVQIINSVCAL